MTPIKQFLFERISQLSNQFPSARFRYGFDRLGGSHIVEVNPDKLLDEVLGDILWDLEIEAANQFPYELVTFISENSCVSLENIEQEWIGEKFKQLLQIPTVETVEAMQFSPTNFQSIAGSLLKEYAPNLDISARLPKQSFSTAYPMNQSQWSGSIHMSQLGDNALEKEFDSTPYAQAA